MLRRRSALSLFIFFGLFAAAAISHSANCASPQTSPPAATKTLLHTARSSPLDLELAGDLAGLPPGSVRYLTRDDLLTLPRVNYTVTGDANLAASTQVRGVALDILVDQFAADPEKAMAIAVCDDLYRAHYSRAYLKAHRPSLVLEINGQPPANWPKSKDGSGSSMAPYLISHPLFTPSFKILGHQDKAQIPWGVVRLEFRNEEALLRSIAPRGPTATDVPVQAGYAIAQQNCWRCHAPQSEGPRKGKLTWEGIALFASASPPTFSNYVRNPQKVAPSAEMPANPTYDDATMRALVSYFRTFFPQDKP